MATSNKTKKRKCHACGGSNSKGPQSSTHLNLIATSRRRNCVRIVKTKMWHLVLSANAANSLSNSSKSSTWRTGESKYQSNIMKKLQTKYHCWSIKPRRGILRNKTSTHFTWSTTKSGQYSKIVINCLRRISTRSNISWRSTISTSWMANWTSMTRKSFMRRMPKRTKKRMRIVLKDKEADQEK